LTEGHTLASSEPRKGCIDSGHKLPLAELSEEVKLLGHSPLLKWPGGKRWVAANVAAIFRRYTGLYVEPFLGGAAVFFELLPPAARLSDVNGELIELYKAVRDDPVRLLQRLWRFPVTARGYLQVRNLQPRSRLSAAARVMYLNRTAFNGIYRVNRFGDFNVPYGHRATRPLLRTKHIRLYVEALQAAELTACDFEVALTGLHPGDRLFVDPPYVANLRERFSRYNSRPFSWTDQRRLADALNSLAAAGVHIIAMNATSDRLLAMYNPALFDAFAVTRQSGIAAKSVHRGRITELLLATGELSEGLRTAGQLRRIRR
jgi:DNA adenine methylase